MEQISKETKIPLASVSWALRALIEAGVIRKVDRKLVFNKNWAEWIGLVANDSNTLESNGLESNSNGLAQDSNRLEKETPHYKVLKDKKERKERAPASRIAFSPPSLEEVKAYCLERNNKVDAQRLHDFYSMKGWKVGRELMKDWRAAVRTWEAEAGFREGGKEREGAPPPLPPKCRGCISPALPGSKFCHTCSWCWPCDMAGRNARATPTEKLVVDTISGHAMCPDCAKTAAKA